MERKKKEVEKVYHLGGYEPATLDSVFYCFASSAAHSMTCLSPLKLSTLYPGIKQSFHLTTTAIFQQSMNTYTMNFHKKSFSMEMCFLTLAADMMGL